MNNYDPIFSVQNKTAIITGASSGLGVTFAEILATRGANVVLSGRRIEKLNDLKAVSYTHLTLPTNREV